MRIATWNVNSVRARFERLQAWLASVQPDVLCLQETKCEDHAFPADECRSIGYHAVFHGQRTYNGVALLSRQEPTLVERGFGDGDDEQARFIAATFAGVRVLNAYVPNGQEVGSPKFAHKLEWLARLRRYLEARHHPTDRVVLCGDFNVAPESRDVYDPAALEGHLHVTPEERGAVAELARWGLVDAFRLHHQEAGLYSWWDYRQLGFPKNLGLRIDLLFLTEPLARACSDCSIDRNERKGKGASDHAPVVATIETPLGRV